MDDRMRGKRDDPHAAAVRLAAGFLIGQEISLQGKIRKRVHDDKRREQRGGSLFNEGAHGVLLVQN